MQSSSSSSITSNSAVPVLNLPNAGVGLGVSSVGNIHGGFAGIHHHHVHHSGTATSVTASHRNGGSANGTVAPTQAATITSMHKWSLEQLGKFHVFCILYTQVKINGLNIASNHKHFSLVFNMTYRIPCQPPT